MRRRRHDCLGSQADLSSPKVYVALGGTEPAVRSRCCGNVDARRSALSEPVRRHQTPLVDIQGCKRKAVILILAITFGKVLRTKPQNLLIRLPIQNLEAVA
jgi:hypothetical protein